jgi:hypothetical protein
VVTEQIALSEVCERVKKMGYGLGSSVRLYGERLEVLSDPFPHGKGIAIRVRAHGDGAERVILLPATVLQSVRERRVTSNA